MEVGLDALERGNLSPLLGIEPAIPLSYRPLSGHYSSLVKIYLHNLARYVMRNLTGMQFMWRCVIRLGCGKKCVQNLVAKCLGVAA
jgi:hypothetical protein